MITVNMIKKDLEDIRYYYSRKDTFESAFDFVGKNDAAEKVDRYNRAICSAPLKLYDIYIAVYVKCCTYETAAEELGFSVNYVYKCNRRIVSYLYEALNKEAA